MANVTTITDSDETTNEEDIFNAQDIKTASSGFKRRGRGGVDI